jgi:F-type H+-transporting ATPase subunit delta
MKKTEPAVIAKKYAKALFDLAKKNNEIDLVLSEMVAIAQIVEKEKILPELVSSNSSYVWQALLDALEGKITTTVKGFLRLLSEMNREALLVECAEQFISICDSHYDVARGTLVTAAKIDPEQFEAMHAIVTAKIGKKVIFKHKNDPAILGGVIAQVGGWTFDDSLRTHLNKISQKLAN